MFGKSFIFAACVWVFSGTACAHPNYQSQQEGSGLQKTTNPSCELKMPISQFCVNLVWEKVPTDTEKGVFTLQFSLNEAATELLQAPSVVLWMPSMGHGSSPVTVNPVDKGLYRISDVYFVMPGEWEIRIQIKDQNGQVDQVVKKITY